MGSRILRRDAYQYDVFVSHATEDKDTVARRLAELLQERGLRVWYDEFELRVSDNLVAKLNEGINGSRFGIIVLSKAFFAKRWTIHELNMLEHLWVTEDRILFPVWHNVTLVDIRSFRPSLANIIGLRTDTYTVKEIADEIHDVILAYDAQRQPTKADEA